MRKLHIILILTAFIMSYSYSQDKVKKSYIPLKPFWSSSAGGGVIIPTGNFSSIYKPSLNLGLELAYNPKPLLTIFFDLGYDILNLKQSLNGSTPAIIELSAGARLYTGRNRLRFFAEGSFGDYIYRYTLYNGVLGAPSSYSNGNLGLKGGVGAEWSFSTGTSFYLKTDYTTIFTSGNKSNFYGVYIGLRTLF